MFTYTHQAKYYETDQMGIIHHSNYIRWMEEARVELMRQIGCGYRQMEQAGIISPVLEVRCSYQAMTYFDDSVEIRVRILEYNGVRLKIGYEMANLSSGQTTTVGESRHCFLDRKGNPVSLKRSRPDWHQAFCKFMEEDKGEE